VERVRKVDQIKEDEMGGARDVLGVEEKRTESSGGKSRERSLGRHWCKWEDILKWNLKEYSERLEVNSSGPTNEKVAESCGYMMGCC